MKRTQSTSSPKRILVTGGAGFIGSNLTLALQEKFPKSDIVILDDFRSGDFKNLRGFRGDIVAKDVSRLDWHQQFGKIKFDAIFHLASVTDTREYNQQLQVHDNVEGFRKVLEFAQPARTPVVYASSAATYGIRSGINRETDIPSPANVYAFSKLIMDNLLRKTAQGNARWKVVGLKYFNVYGPRESHKGVPASMIYHLSQQMHSGKNPRIFKYGEQKRDFVYVKDVVKATILGLQAKASGIYNAGSGQSRSFNELIAILNHVLKTKFEPEYFDNPYSHYQVHTEAELTLSKKNLGYAPDYTLERGVEEYMQWLYPELRKG